MKVQLREFQREAVRELASLLDVAKYGANKGKLQAVGLTATTGAGKTIMATALVERIIFGTDDEETSPDPNAVFLWITDLPELNLQTREKMIHTSSRLGSDRLIVIENSFDEPELAPGRVYFVNTQKLGAKGMLNRGPSDVRSYPFWETVRRTIETAGRTFYLIVDEAHRGMTEGKKLEEANSIIQRFIKGTDMMPAAPIVIGISATPERYRRVVESSGRSVSEHDVPPEDVRKSGLIKEHIGAVLAGETQKDAMALLVKAAEAWQGYEELWTGYHPSTPDEKLVVPALIVQVENEGSGRPTQTDLAAVIKTITDVVGPLPDSAFAHSFGEPKGGIAAGSRKVRYIEPHRIEGDTSVRVVFFKTGLGTGWDCPRAEVMFSFRKAVDYTHIAQTIGRMVRTPLARSIEEDERLNAVDVFLPYYNRTAVNQIVEHLKASGDSAIADAIEDRSNLMSLWVRAGSDDAVAAIEALPSYEVPAPRERKEVRRLVDLARALSKHGIDEEAYDREAKALTDLLLERRERLQKDPAFIKAVNDQGEIIIERVEWAVGDAKVATADTLSIPASEEAIGSLFAGAKRTVGGDVAMAYWKRRVNEDDDSTDKARLEAYALSQRPETMRALNDHSSRRISDLFMDHGGAIEELGPAKRATYDRIRGSAPDPTLTPIHMPGTIEFKRGKDLWAKHLYAGEDGSIPLTFTSSWEVEVLGEVIDDSQTIAWLRNEPRKDRSFCVPWSDKNVERPMYPDFIVVRDVGDRKVVDVLDPHDHSRQDAVGKAKGLARYARKHGTGLGHIDLIARVDGHLRRLHLEDEKTRKLVDQVDGLAGLLNLYKQA